MISIPPIWAAGAAGAVFILAALGVTRYQLNSCRTESVKVHAAYEILLERVNTQNAAIDSLEKASKKSIEKARKLQEAASKQAILAEGRSKSLEALLRAPRPLTECVPASAVEVVRADLLGK